MTKFKFRNKCQFLLELVNNGHCYINPLLTNYLNELNLREFNLLLDFLYSVVNNTVSRSLVSYLPKFVLTNEILLTVLLSLEIYEQNQLCRKLYQLV